MGLLRRPRERRGAPAPLPGGRWAHAYARTVVALRWPIIAAWVVVAYLVLTVPAPQAPSSDGDLDGFVSGASESVAVEKASAQEFGFPLLGRTAIVQHDPDGLDVYAQTEAVLRAVALSEGQYPDVGPVRGAIPVTNTLGFFPGSTARGTTVVTYLLMDPTVSLTRQTRAAQAFAKTYLSDPDDHYVGVTGTVPARVATGTLISDALPVVELATLAAILLIVGFVFRAVAAPLIALGTAGLAFLVATRIAAYGQAAFGVPIPRELEPLVLALVLGVVTDYVIFFVSGMKVELRDGHDVKESARRAAASYGPIVVVAGITVAAGTASLLVARFAFFATFGPALALAVLVALVVSVTLVPAVLAVLGRVTFWPAVPRPQVLQVAGAGAGAGDRLGLATGLGAGTTVPAARRGARDRPPASSLSPGAAARIRGQLLDAPADHGPSRRQRRGIVLLTRRPVAALVALLCVGALAWAATPITQLRLGLSYVPSLPGSSDAAQAADAATGGFTDGILSPTLLLVRGDDVTARTARLKALDAAVTAVPGVAGVLGPGELPAQIDGKALLAPDRGAARFLIVMEDEPLGGLGVETFDRLQDRLPALMDQAGLGDDTWGLGGDTALAAALVTATQADLGRIAVAALLVNFLLLVLFLRALVAPAYLLACTTLALAASLGLLVHLFQGYLGHDSVTFYVPFAAAALLLSLGSDYTVFGVGHVWAVARTKPLRAAIVEAVPQTSKAITAAGVTLAVSFGLLALVPLRPFRELAFVMAVGILIDAIVVRSFLVPTLLSLVGRASGWPGHAISGRPRTPDTDPAHAAAREDDRATT